MKYLASLFFLFLGLALFTSCDPEPPVEPVSADVKVTLKTYVKGVEAEENVIKYNAEAGHKYSLLNLRYYITHINLVKDDGKIVELKKAHLFNNHEVETHSMLIKDVAPAHFKALKFTFGFSKGDNVFDFLPNTTANANMAWPDQLGPGAYHYMKFEGQYDKNNTGEIKNFAYHLGPTKGADFSFDVNLPIDMTIDGGTKKLSIIMDLDQWLQNPNNYDFEEWGPGIMNKPAAQTIAQANGEAGVFSAKVE